MEPVCECASVPQLPVFPVRPVRLEDHTYANQVFAVLASTVLKETFTLLFVLYTHHHWTILKMVLLSHWRKPPEFDVSDFIYG